MSNHIFKRAGGRRRYNKERQASAQQRRIDIIDLLVEDPDFTAGWQTWVAECLEVHRGTVSRDIRRIIKDYRATGFKGLGPRSNAKTALLEQLAQMFEKKDGWRKFLNAQMKVSRAKEKAKHELKHRSMQSTCVLPQLAQRLSAGTSQRPASDFEQRSRFSRMRCFPS